MAIETWLSSSRTIGERSRTPRQRTGHEIRHGTERRDATRQHRIVGQKLILSLGSNRLERAVRKCSSMLFAGCEHRNLVATVFSMITSLQWASVHLGHYASIAQLIGPPDSHWSTLIANLVNCYQSYFDTVCSLLCASSLPAQLPPPPPPQDSQLVSQFQRDHLQMAVCATCRLAG